MNDNRLQHLSEAFNSIISMMLAEIRARGLRSLIDLPAMIMAALYLRRLGKAFTALVASIDLSALPPPAPVPPASQAAPAQPEPATRPESATRARPRPAASPGAHRVRPAACPQPILTTPKPPARRTRTRHQAFPRPLSTPDPRARQFNPPHARLHSPARTSRARHQPRARTRAQFVTN